MPERYTFKVNGLDIHAEFAETDRTEIFLPLLRKLTRLQKEIGRRICVFLAAPPAAGKSTLCCYLELLSRKTEGITPVQCVGMDGFHLPNAVLTARTILRDGAEIPLRQIKGTPETFDVESLARHIAQLPLENQRWPAYDRRIHDPVADAIAITADIIIVEGNWLLLNEAPWDALECDYSIFLHAGDEAQLERVVQRKIMGGFEEAAARAFVRGNDWPNIQRCMAHSKRGDLNLAMQDGHWIKI